MKLVIGGQAGRQEFDVQASGDSVSVGDVSYAVRTVRRGDILTVYVNEKPFAIQLSGQPSDGPMKLLVDAKEYEVELKGRTTAPRPRPHATERRGPAGGKGAVTAQMTGRIIRVDVKPGDQVNAGDILLIIEAMKMENEIAAPMSGVVKAVAVAAGARVSEGDLLVQLEPRE